ncbi:MAG: hypothetical protein Q8K69_06270 [Bacteroidota bacterium]|jgi:hypothetical protein|nr:hypothetical protein [Bacteroidota bacterium]MDP3434552.1 hypothetical protein [Bacteroidota bacterium]
MLPKESFHVVKPVNGKTAETIKEIKACNSSQRNGNQGLPEV